MWSKKCSARSRVIRAAPTVDAMRTLLPSALMAHATRRAARPQQLNHPIAIAAAR